MTTEVSYNIETEQIWDVSINDTDHYVIKATTATYAMCAAGDRWRATNTGGQDIGAIKSMTIRIRDYCSTCYDKKLLTFDIGEQTGSRTEPCPSCVD